MAKIDSIVILGVRVDDVTMNEACDPAAALIAAGGVHQFATVNPEFIMAARRDQEFADVLDRSALNAPDGVGILWAARRQARHLRQRVAGVELMQEFCARGSAYHWRVFFLGARPGVAERAAATLALKYPGLMVCGTYAGSPAREEEQMIVERIRRARPNLLFVAYGAPAQDKWLGRNLSSLWPDSEMAGSNKGLIGMGVGGSLDFIAGAQKRAPEWMQRAGLEWLYRLLRDPSRWRRQLALARFVASVMLQSK